MDQSAGILLTRRLSGGVEVLIGRMGGPMWRSRPRAWSVPKGLIEPGETPLAAALREFREEIGVPAPDVPYAEVGAFRQSRKTVVVYTADVSEHPWSLDVEGRDPARVTIEWPPRSGRTMKFLELEDVSWVPVDVAAERLVAGQVAALSLV